MILFFNRFQNVKIEYHNPRSRNKTTRYAWVVLFRPTTEIHRV